MSVTPCQRISQDIANGMPSIIRATPEVFIKRWKKLNGTMQLSSSYRQGMHSLIIAAINGKYELITYLYKKDHTLLNLGDSAGWTPLFYAVYVDKLETAQLLLDLGANPNIATIQPFEVSKKGSGIPKGATSLWIAAQKCNCIAMSKLLLKYGGVAAPALDNKGQLIFNDAQQALNQERTTLQTAIDNAVNLFPVAMLQMIVQYV